MAKKCEMTEEQLAEKREKRREYFHRYYLEHKDKIDAKNRAWGKEHYTPKQRKEKPELTEEQRKEMDEKRRAKRREYCRKYHASHREERLAYMREYQASHREERRDYQREYRARNREWRSEHPEKAIQNEIARWQRKLERLQAEKEDGKNG